jgi:hypothetical protein
VLMDHDARIAHAGRAIKGRTGRAFLAEAYHNRASRQNRHTSLNPWPDLTPTNTLARRALLRYHASVVNPFATRGPPCCLAFGFPGSA